MGNNNTILEVHGLNKYFGPTHANKNVEFELRAGEVHGLIGENGSGKSTLLSQIAGIYPYDSGEILINGQPYVPHSPLDANDNKIAMVLQELGVVGNLPAGVNVFLGRTNEFSKGGVLNLRKMNKAAQEIFEKWNLEMPPLNQLTDGMMIEQRKMVELARALAIEPNILILDELTQSLSLNNRQKLYALCDRFKEENRSVIVITHDIEEMIAMTDRITVLRDGEVVGTVDSKTATEDDIRRMMVGREVSGEYYRADMVPTYEDDVYLAAENLTVAGEFENVSFELHKGEILGFCGLSDSGIHSVGKALFGLSKIKEGAVNLKVNGVNITSAPQALGNNMGYVPKDRDNEALMIHASINNNFTLPSLKELTGPIASLNPGKLGKLSTKMKDKLSVKCTGIHQNMDALSGGNKQKVNLGRWLAKDLKVLILDCPTRGVDVGVKAYIYQLMREAKTEGIAMILISDELTEVLGMADRLLVMKDGKVTKEIRRDEDFTENSVIGVMI